MSVRRRDDDSDYRQRKQMKSGNIIKMLCPFYSAGAVIGEKGCHFKQMKEDADCSIDITKQTVRYPDTDERVITIQGETENLIKVVKLIQDKIRDDKIPSHVKNIDPKANDKRKEVCKVVVSESTLGALIGKGGENVNRIKDTHNVTIEIQKKTNAIPGLSERLVSVTGDYDKVDDCVAEIITQVVDDDRHHMQHYIDYAKFNRRGYDGGRDDNGKPRDDYYSDRRGYGDRDRFDDRDRGRYGDRGYNDRSSYGSRGLDSRSGYGDRYNDRGYDSRGSYNDDRGSYGARGYADRDRGYGDRDRGYGDRGGYGDRPGYSYDSRPGNEGYSRGERDRPYW